MTPSRRSVCFAALISVTLFFTRSSAQPPSCPGASQQQYGGTLTYGQSATIPVNLQPCEEVTFAVSTTSDTWYGAAMTFVVKNSQAQPQQLYGKNWFNSGTVNNSHPLTPPWYTTLRGTRGIEGLPGNAILSNTYSQYPVTYTITVSKSPRPAYNLGGTSFSNAPLIPLREKQYGSLSPFEPGQYYKIHLAGNERIYMKGQALGFVQWGSGFNIGLYDANMVFIQNKYVAAYGLETFQTTAYTNPSSQEADFYIRVWAQWWATHDFQFTVESPQLSLFLDADGNFDVNAPTSDDATYLPGTVFTTGASASVATVEGSGQATQVIAAYVDSSGQIVPAVGTDPVRFELTSVSAFPGIAMNYGMTGTAPDFSLEGQACQSGGGFCATFQGDNTARITLRAKDYGGNTTVAAGRGAASAEPLKIPKDDGEDGGNANNLLPDGGWRFFADGVEYNAPGAADIYATGEDSENLPSYGPPGDGLSALEEYRGFVVRGEHRRINPRIKDLFIDSDVNTYNIGDAILLPLNKHRLFASEMDQGRVINFNAPGAVVPQKAVVVREMGTDPSGEMKLGTANCPGDVPCTPNDAGTVHIFIAEIRDESPPCSSKATPPCSNSYNIEDQPADGHMIPLVVGHEIGHRIKLPHASLSTPPSIMWPGKSLIPMLNADWTNAPHFYAATELTFLQLH